MYYVKLHPFVRQQALKSLLAFGATEVTILGLSKLAGADVGTDPKSSDFGKIRLGKLRLDITGGNGTFGVLLARLITKQTKNSTTGKITTLGQGYKTDSRRWSFSGKDGTPSMA